MLLPYQGQETVADTNRCPENCGRTSTRVCLNRSVINIRVGVHDDGLVVARVGSTDGDGWARRWQARGYATESVHLSEGGCCEPSMSRAGTGEGC